MGIQDHEEEIRVTYDAEDEIYIVDSESEQRYFVSNDVESCTCSDFKSRNRICRHINTVNSALVQAEEEIRNLEENEVMAVRIQRDIRDEIERNQEGQSLDDGFFDLENLNEFDRIYENINDDLINISLNLLLIK